MTPDQRRELEDAISAWGHAKQMLAVTNGARREAWLKATEAMWEKVMKAVDVVEGT